MGMNCEGRRDEGVAERESGEGGEGALQEAHRLELLEDDVGICTSGSSAVHLGREDEGESEGDALRTFLVLLGRHPHLLERAQAGEDRAADPGRVFALGRRADPDLGIAQRELLDLVQEAVAETCARRGGCRGTSAGRPLTE